MQKFIFEDFDVRGSLIKVSDGWQEVLRRRRANSQTGPWPQPVLELAGEMTIAAILLQNAIDYDGVLGLQIMGEGPVKLAVAQVQADLGFRTTVNLTGSVAAQATLADLVNPNGRGRCAMTLQPREGSVNQKAYQSIVSLVDEKGRTYPRVATCIEHFMRQSEQIETALVLAADEKSACGLFLQCMPIPNGPSSQEGEQAMHFERISILAKSLTAQELLTLDTSVILHRLFWQESVMLLTAPDHSPTPHFHCPCSHERMINTLRTLGREEAERCLGEKGVIEINCDFCGRQERLDAVDVASIFAGGAPLHSGSSTVQ